MYSFQVRLSKYTSLVTIIVTLAVSSLTAGCKSKDLRTDNEIRKCITETENNYSDAEERASIFQMLRRQKSYQKSGCCASQYSGIFHNTGYEEAMHIKQSLLNRIDILERKYPGYKNRSEMSKNHACYRGLMSLFHDVKLRLRVLEPLPPVAPQDDDNS